MTVNVTLSQILNLAPSTRLSYRDAFQDGQAVLDQHNISETPLRVAHFMAQVPHESGGLAIQFEDFSYSAAEHILPSGELRSSSHAFLLHYAYTVIGQERQHSVFRQSIHQA